MKVIAPLIALTLCLHAACAQGVYYAPDQATIAALEAGSFLPAGAHPIGEYARYYVGLLRDGHHMIQAELVRGQPPGIHVVSGPGQFPVIMDGGCWVINILYDAESRQFQSVRCNGFG